jgi:hypothetical protein
MTADMIVWTLLSLAAVLGFVSLALWIVESLEPAEEEKEDD